jgi:hypothetical protein
MIWLSLDITGSIRKIDAIVFGHLIEGENGLDIIELEVIHIKGIMLHLHSVLFQIV